jgi:hypothetical protein
MSLIDEVRARAARHQEQLTAAMARLEAAAVEVEALLPVEAAPPALQLPKKANGKAEVPTRPCVDCGVALTRRSNGPWPRRCKGCNQTHRRARQAATQRKRATEARAVAEVPPVEAPFTPA